MKLIKTSLTFICLAAYVQLISLFSFDVAKRYYPFFNELDPDNVFMVLVIHHFTGNSNVVGNIRYFQVVEYTV